MIAKMKITLMLKTLMCLLTLWISQANAGIYTGISNDGLTGSGSGHSNNDYAGWVFSVNEPINILALGLWAGTDNILAESHEVGIFSLNGQVETSLIVSDSGTYVSNDNYVFKDLKHHYQLPVGNWFIGAFFKKGSADRFLVNGDGGTFSDGSFTVGKGIDFIDHRVYYSGVVGGPKFVGKTFLGANFTYETVSVNEPGTLVLFSFLLIVTYFRKLASHSSFRHSSIKPKQQLT